MSKRSAPSTVKRSAPFTAQISEGFEERWEAFIKALSSAERAILEAAGLLGSGTATDASRRLRADLMLLFDAGYGITSSTLAQVRSMNAGARGELREKTQWIKARINEGYTREQARHLYYEWAGEGDDPQSFNPNRTLSDEEVDKLYEDWSAGNTPRALQKRIVTGGQLVTDKDGNQSIRYEGKTYRINENGLWVPQEQLEVQADGGVTILPAETTVGGLNVRDINYVRDVFEQRGYEATPEEIEEILTNSRINDLEGASQGSIEVILSGEVGTYVNENTVNIKDLYRIFQAELGRRPTTEEVNELIGGTRSSVQGSEDFVTDYINTTVAPRPEGTVDLKELNEDQLSTFWPEIKESLEGLSETVKNVLFGTGGPPSTLGELLDSIGEGIMEGLKGPIAVTFDPNEGVTLDLKIPVGFEINGTSIQIPIFDEEGNLVTGEELKKVFVDAAGRLWDSTGGVLKEIGEIFTDGSGNIVVDIIDAGQAVLEGVGLSEDGALVGTLVEAAIGDFQYDPGTGKIIEEVEASVDDLGLDEGEENGLADTVDGDGDDDLGLTDITKEESEDKPLTPPKGSKYITDKDGNIVRAIGPDGTIYRVDENNEWSVSTSDVVTEEEETTVLPAETTISNGTEEEAIDEDDTRQEESVEIPLDTVEETELFEQEEVIEEDDTRQEESVEIPLDTVEETELTEDTVVITDGGDGGGDDGQPPLTNGGDGGGDDGQPPLNGGDDSGDTDEQPPLTSEPIIDDDVQEEPPLVGPPGADGVDGAAGAAGAPGSRGGYMGGLSYQLPQFVGVQYQPKDYTVELNRIINESLFKGMI